MIDNYKELDLSYLELSEDEILLKPDIYNSDENLIAIKVFKSVEELKNEWKNVQNFIAGNIQSNLESFQLADALVWNIYLLFIIPNDIEIEKYFIGEIESNKFCCKKYILKVADITNLELIKNEIKNHIPLFSNFDFSLQGGTSSSEDTIKEHIYEETNNSILARIFKSKNDIKNITEEINIQKFINELKEEYQK